MTWVIGSPTSFGYAMGLSDVQVSWGKDGPRHDCLRKVYAVAPFIAAGFSGSVRLGFKLLDDLTEFLSPLPESGESWIPRRVALNWYRRARWIFDGEPITERQLGSHIMLMGVRPRDNSGCITGGRPDVITLSAKNKFEPKFVESGEVESIGCGNNVEHYMTELNALQEDPWAIMNAEVGNHGGMGRAWASSLARVLIGKPVPGISQTVHLTLVSRNYLLIEPLELTKFSADGTKTEYKMPRVAKGWDEFTELADELGVAAAEARG